MKRIKMLIKSYFYKISLFFSALSIIFTLNISITYAQQSDPQEQKGQVASEETANTSAESENLGDLNEGNIDEVNRGEGEDQNQNLDQNPDDDQSSEEDESQEPDAGDEQQDLNENIDSDDKEDLSEPSIDPTVIIKTPETVIFTGDVLLFSGCDITDSTGIVHQITGPKAICALDQASSIGGFTYTVEDSDFGLYLTEVAEIPADASNFWLYKVNGVSPFVGIDSYDLSPGDTILFYFASWPPPVMVNADRTAIQIGETINFHITIFTGDWLDVKNKKLWLDQNTSYLSDQAGRVSVTFQNAGEYSVFSGDEFNNPESNTLTIRVVDCFCKDKTPPTADEVEEAKDKAEGYLKDQQDEEGEIENQGTSDWSALAFGSSDEDPETIKKDNGKSLQDSIKAGKDKLNPNLATDWARRILAILASGEDPRNFGGFNYLEKLLSFYNHNQLGDPNLINDDIFGLLSLIGAGEDPNREAIKAIINFIISHQNNDGSFGFSLSDPGSVDMTAAAIMALVAAKNANLTQNLDSVFTLAKEYLLSTQYPDGGFPYSIGDPANAASTAWAIMALLALGIDPETLVTPYGCTPFSFLLSLQKIDGSFSWLPGTDGLPLITAYVIPALNRKTWPIIYQPPPQGSFPDQQEEKKEENGEENGKDEDKDLEDSHEKKEKSQTNEEELSTGEILPFAAQTIKTLHDNLSDKALAAEDLNQGTPLETGKNPLTLKIIFLIFSFSLISSLGFGTKIILRRYYSGSEKLFSGGP